MGISFFQLLVILLIVLVLFGRGKLPALAEDIGKSVKAFRKGIEDADKDDKKAVENKSEDKEK